VDAVSVGAVTGALVVTWCMYTLELCMLWRLQSWGSWTGGRGTETSQHSETLILETCEYWQQCVHIGTLGMCAECGKGYGLARRSQNRTRQLMHRHWQD